MFLSGKLQKTENQTQIHCDVGSELVWTSDETDHESKGKYFTNRRDHQPDVYFCPPCSALRVVALTLEGVCVNQQQMLTGGSREHVNGINQHRSDMVSVEMVRYVIVVFSDLWCLCVLHFRATVDFTSSVCCKCCWDQN